MNRMRLTRHERMYGPHFNDLLAHKAINHLENEDGSNGPKWSLEESEKIAQQFGVRFDRGYNRYDWFVALNVIRSDFYRAVKTITGSDNVKFYVELTKAWLDDKDVDEGKMWYYFKYIMCNEDDEDDSYQYNYTRSRSPRHIRNEDYYDGYEYELEYNMRGGNYAMDGHGNYARRNMSRYN